MCILCIHYACLVDLFSLPLSSPSLPVAGAHQLCRHPPQSPGKAAEGRGGPPSPQTSAKRGVGRRGRHRCHRSGHSPSHRNETSVLIRSRHIIMAVCVCVCVWLSCNCFSFRQLIRDIWIKINHHFSSVRVSVRHQLLAFHYCSHFIHELTHRCHHHLVHVHPLYNSTGFSFIMTILSQDLL